MIYSLAGGSKSGKSLFAQRIACSMPAPHYYVATMRPHDAEDEARIAKHIDARAGWGFRTVEQPERIEDVLSRCDAGGTILLDSVTALRANELFPPAGPADPDAPARVEAGLLALARERANLVFVSDYLFADGAAYGALTEAFLAGLGRIGCALAKAADGVAFFSCGLPVWYKGGWTA
jgi:adenosylcobinamide kinase/adenosylcobinamide-phosphate guanylyltransferase